MILLTGMGRGIGVDLVSGGMVRGGMTRGRGVMRGQGLGRAISTTPTPEQTAAAECRYRSRYLFRFLFV